jgi:hypothetical protein
MFAASQNYSSPMGSPHKRVNIENNSPVSSPMKQIRPASNYDLKVNYTPVQKDQVIGTPIEIIKGKSRLLKLNSVSFRQTVLGCRHQTTSELQKRLFL